MVAVKYTQKQMRVQSEWNGWEWGYSMQVSLQHWYHHNIVQPDRVGNLYNVVQPPCHSPMIPTFESVQS